MNIDFELKLVSLAERVLRDKVFEGDHIGRPPKLEIDGRPEPLFVAKRNDLFGLLKGFAQRFLDQNKGSVRKLAKGFEDCRTRHC